MSAKTSVTDIIVEHYDTLRDQSTSRVSWRDLLVQQILPALAAIAAAAIGFRFERIGDLIAGLAIMTGFTFGLLVFVFQLRLQVTVDPRHHDDQWLKTLIDQLFQNVAYALLVGFAAVVVAVVVSSAHIPVNPLPAGWGSFIITALLIFLTLHYVLTMAMCAKRLNRAYSSLND